MAAVRVQFSRDVRLDENLFHEFEKPGVSVLIADVPTYNDVRSPYRCEAHLRELRRRAQLVRLSPACVRHFNDKIAAMPSRLRMFALLLAVAGLVVSGGRPSWAHTPVVPLLNLPLAEESSSPVASSRAVAETAQVTITAAPNAPAAPWIVVVLAGLIVLTSVRRPRRAFAVAFVLILTIFAFESGVHSAHHISDEPHASHCAIASAAGQLTGVAGGCAAFDPLILPAHEAVIGTDPASAVDGVLGSPQGRAPPVLCS